MLPGNILLRGTGILAQSETSPPLFEMTQHETENEPGNFLAHRAFRGIVVAPQGVEAVRFGGRK